MTAQQVADGARTLAEWLGEGAHPALESQARADVCKACPLNYRGRWLIPDALAASIKRIAEIKSNMALTVEGEAELGWCEACNCNLALKVHVPLSTILNHTPDATLDKFPGWCWLKTERQKP